MSEDKYQRRKEVMQQELREEEYKIQDARARLRRELDNEQQQSGRRSRGGRHQQEEQQGYQQLDHQLRRRRQDYEHQVEEEDEEVDELDRYQQPQAVEGMSERTISTYASSSSRNIPYRNITNNLSEEENLKNFGPLKVHEDPDDLDVDPEDPDPRSFHFNDNNSNNEDNNNNSNNDSTDSNSNSNNNTEPSPAQTEAAMLYDEQKPVLRRRRPTLTEEELAVIPRLVHRNMPFHQSRQDIAVVNSTVQKSLRLQWILSHDWYHVILRWPTTVSVVILLGFWTVNIIIFAAIYQALDTPESDCGLGKPGESITFNSAFAFSLETCTTVGYGLPNSTNGFFEAECGKLQAVIFFQMVWSMLFNAFLFAFLFARLARCEQRGVQVLFSDKAIIEHRNGKWYMHVRVYDMDSQQPVVEAHVRMYCVSWRDYENQTKDLVQPHLLHAMRIVQPDDDYGAHMFTSIPANVTHHIDAFSPLAPWQIRKRTNVMRGEGMVPREVDGIIGNAAHIPCPVCGETFGSHEQLKAHIRYQKIIEEHDDYPILGTHRDPSVIMPRHTKPMVLTENDIREQLSDKEIMCVVEGIEPMVSGTFQALQSYKLKDMVFGGRFAPCMKTKGGKIFVDVDKFHQILDPHDSSMHHYMSRQKGLH